MQMAQELVGPGVDVISATYVGDGNSKGIFTAFATSLPMTNGVVLSSGFVTPIGAPAGGPVMSANTSGGSDPDLDLLSTGSINDAAYLEFQFRAIGTEINFEFVFGSEEYPQYNCTSFNDVFGFFLSGPGIVGKKNLALVPGTNIPVTINTINNGVPGPGGNILNCTSPGPGSPFTAYYINNSGSTTIEFNGLTTTLLATQTVQSCQIYTIKLAISDVSDSALDSGVFIKSNSFSSEVVTLDITSDPVFPACPTNSATFTANVTNGVPPIVYSWYLNNSSVGTDNSTLTLNNLHNGDKIFCIINSFADCSGNKVISNEITVTFLPYTYETLNVAICQGQSYVFNGITYTTSTNAPLDTLPNPPGCDKIVNLHLVVNPSIQATMAPIGPFCIGDTPPSLPGTSSNTPPLAGTWSPPTINTSAAGTSSYTFTPDPSVCALPVTIDITINPKIIPTFNQLGPYCKGAVPGTLPGSSTNSPPITGTWSPAVISTGASGSTVYTFTPGAGICATQTTMTIVINEPVLPTFAPIGPLCQNSTAPTLPGSSTNAPPITGTWSPAVINTSTPGTVTYTFTPTAGQCALPATMSITIDPEITPTFTQLGPYCKGATPPTLPGSSTNAPPITGTWSPSVINTSNPGSFVYTFTPTAGICAKVVTMTIVIDPPIQPTFTQLGPYCKDAVPGTFSNSSTNVPPITGTWNPAVINTSAPGSFVYTFTPTAGQCADPALMTIVIDPPVIPTFAPIAPLCQNSTPIVLPNTSNNSPGITGTWSPMPVNTSTVGTSTYTFTPTPGLCALPTTLDITIKAPIVPVFTPIGPLCQNSSAPALPTSSNDAPPIMGTWVPSVINTSTAGTFIFTFTPNASECALPTTMSIVIDPEITPTFTQLGPYCKNATPDILPNNSNNIPPIPGTWNPAVINTSTPGTTTYTFTPNAGVCAKIVTMMITIDAPILPTFTQLGPYCKDAIPGILPLSSTNSPAITGTWIPAIINTSTPGTFVFTFTPDAGQCADPATMSVVINPPVLPTFVPIPPICLNATPVVLPNNSTNSPPITGSWNPNPVNTSTLGTTTYTFTPNVGECALPTTMDITIKPPIVPTFSPFGPYCQNSAGITLPSSSTNAPPITGSWSPSVVNTSTPGITTYTFTPSAIECATPISVQIEILPEILPVFTQLGPYCYGDPLDPLPTNSENTPPIPGTWSPSVIDPNGTGAVVYTFTPTPGICSPPITMVITINKPVQAFISTIGPFCLNSIPPNLPLISNDVPPITGTWSPSVISTSAVGVINYTFTPDPGQCTSPTNIPITIFTPPTPTFTQLGPFCKNSAGVTLPNFSNDNPTVTGIWNPAVVNTANAGNSVYTFTPDPGQCAGPATMSINITAPTIPSFDGIGPFCNGEIPPSLPALSTNNPPIVGNWDPPFINTTVNGPSIYTFTPNENECASINTLSIIINPLPQINISPVPQLCIDSAAVTLTATPAGGTWSGTNVIGNTFDPLAGGTFSIFYTYTDGNGCTNVASTDVVVNDCSCMNPASADAGPDGSICEGGTFNLNGQIFISSNSTWSSTGTGIFGNVSNPITTYTPSQADYALGSVTLTLLAFDPDGSGPCSATSDQMVLTITNTPVNIFPVQPLCANDQSFMLNASPPGGIWAGQGVLGNFFDPASAGAGVHTVTYTLTGGCTGSGSINITVHPGVNVSINPVAQLCSDDPAVFLVGNPAGGIFLGPGITGNVFTPSTPGTFNIDYLYTDGNLCSYIATIPIVVVNCNCINPPIANAGSDANICPNTPYNLTGSISFSNSSLWTTSGTGVFANASNAITTYTPSAADLLAGSVTLTLTALDPDGIGPCIAASDDMVITFNIISIQIDPVNPICSNNAIVTLNALPSGGTFSGSGVSGNTFNPMTAGPGSHVITYTISTPCPSNKTITIIVNPLPLVSINNIADLCLDDAPVALTGNPAGGTFSGGGIVGNVFTPSSVGNFTINYTYTNSNGCTAASSTTIGVTDCNCTNPASANAGPNAIVCEGNTYQLFGSITVAASASWSTSGDGTFNNPLILNSIYTPGSNDLANGSVILALTTSDPDGVGPCSPVSDDITLTFEQLSININIQAPICIDAGLVTLVATPSGGVFSGVGVSGNTFDPSIAGTGVHVVTYTVSGNCSGFATISITVNPLPIINIDNVGLLCIDDSPITLTASPTGGVFTGINVNAGIFTPSSAGVFAITYKYTDTNGCDAESMINITVNDCGCLDPALANAGSDASICKGSDYQLNGSIGIALASQWSTSGDGTFDNVNALNAIYTPGPSDILSGAVILTLTTSDPDGNGPCHEATDQMTLTITTIPVNINQAGPLCIDGGIITLSAIPSGGIFSGAGIIGNNFDPLMAGVGNHVINYTLNGNCPASTTTLITVNPLPIVNINAVGPLCIDDDPVLLVGLPSGGTFSGGGIVNNIFTPSNAGTFTVKYSYSDGNGCTNSITSDILIEDCGCLNPATAYAGNDINICAGQIASLNGIITVSTNAIWSTSGDGVFSNSQSLSSDYTPGVLDIANGSVTLSLITSDPDGSGPCHAALDLVVITISQIQIVITPVQNVCIDGNLVTLSATPANGVFSGAGVSGNIFNPAIAGQGSHTITYTIGGNCPGSKTFVIIVNPLPLVSIASAGPLCIDDAPITLNGSPSGGTFSGQGVTNNSFNPTQAGIFTIGYVFINNNGCTNSASIDIAVNDCGCANPASANAGPNGIICAGQKYNVNGTISGTTNSIWTTSGTGTFDDPASLNTVYNPSASDIINGSVTLMLTAIDPDGSGPCHSFTDELKLTITPSPNIDILTSPISLCLDDDPINLSANPSNGAWSGNGVSGSTFNPGIAGLGSHTIYYNVQSGNCSSIDSVILSVTDCGCNILISVNAGPDLSICENGKILINAQVTGTSNFTWSTSGSGTFVNKNYASTEYIPSTLDRLNQVIILTITTEDPDGAGPCISKKDEISVRITTLIDVDLLVDHTDCLEATGSVTVLPPASNLLIFSVDDGGTFTELPIFKGLLPGNYTLIYKEPISGCQSSTNFVIDPPPVVTANWKLTSKACTSALTNFIDVLSTQNMTMPIFIYVDNNLMVTTSKLPVKIDNLSIGDHTLIITDSKGCEITDDFSITESSNIDIDIQGVYVVDEGEEVTLIPEISGPYTSIIWTPGTYLSCTTCLTPRCKPKKEITYTVEVTNEQGCKDEITVRVVIRKKINIFVPNIFTPNGDGVNDLVTVFTDDNIKIIDNLKIFSRWGELVFERSNFIPNIESEGWDGIFKNQEMNPAVFAWVVEVNIPGEGIRILKGDVTLIR